MLNAKALEPPRFPILTFDEWEAADRTSVPSTGSDRSALTKCDRLQHGEYGA
jgi:hypothetical protein